MIHTPVKEKWMFCRKSSSCNTNGFFFCFLEAFYLLQVLHLEVALRHTIDYPVEGAEIDTVCIVAVVRSISSTLAYISMERNRNVVVEA